MEDIETTGNNTNPPKRFTRNEDLKSSYWKRTHYNFSQKDFSQKELLQHAQLLHQKDDLADKVVECLFYKYDRPELVSLIQKALSDEEYLKLNAPQELQNLIREIKTSPSWVDFTKIEQGAQFCRRTGSLGFLVLRNYCLMGGYQSPAINKPLIKTGALKKDAGRRLAETTKFWVSIIEKNALHIEGKGFSNILMVRLLHAHLRVELLKGNSWDSSIWGTPINQWDMLATNLGFSLVFLDGLKRIGINPTQGEKEGVMHLWKYIGVLMGIPVEILPDTEEAAHKELYKWTITQPLIDEETKLLAKSLVYEPLGYEILKFNWQKRLLIELNLSYNYFFLGSNACKKMGLRLPAFRPYPYLIRFSVRLINKIVISRPNFLKIASYFAYKYQLIISDIYSRIIVKGKTQH